MRDLRSGGCSPKTLSGCFSFGPMRRQQRVEKSARPSASPNSNDNATGVLDIEGIVKSPQNEAHRHRLARYAALVATK